LSSVKGSAVKVDVFTGPTPRAIPPQPGSSLNGAVNETVHQPVVTAKQSSDRTATQVVDLGPLDLSSSSVTPR